MIAVFLALAAAPMPGSSGIYPPPFPPSTGGSSGFMQPSRDALNLEYEGKAKVLQAEMRALQKSDGAELTAEHRAYLQEKVDMLLGAYRRDLQRVDPFH